MVQFLRFSREEHGSPRLLEEEDNENHEKSVNDDLEIEDPAPGGMLRNESTDQRPQSRARQCARCEQRHGSIAILGMIDVTHHAAHHGAEGGRSTTGQKATDQHARKCRRHTTHDLKDHPQEARRHEDGSTSINLAKGCEKHGRDPETCGKGGHADESGDSGNVPFGHHLVHAGRVCGCIVSDEESDDAGQPCHQTFAPFRPEERGLVVLQVGRIGRRRLCATIISARLWPRREMCWLRELGLEFEVFPLDLLVSWVDVAVVVSGTAFRVFLTLPSRLRSHAPVTFLILEVI